MRRASALLPLLLFASLFAPGSATARALTLATLDWPPYIGHALPGQGYAAALAREALGRSGHEVRFVFLPWLRAVQGTRAGYHDGYIPAYADEDQGRDVLCAGPFPGGPLALFARAGSTLTYSGIEDLRGLRVGVVLGYKNTPVIDKTPWLDRQQAADDLTNLRKLLAGRVDVAVADVYVAAYLAPELDGGYAALRLVVVLEEKDLAVCFSTALPDHEALVRDFDRGLDAMRADGTLERLQCAHGCAVQGGPGLRP
ncbi:substrate-binding periplasmic protein [Desulfocurvus vexinensis]|uniref:substrate-binding periplasmic protein n=1 Tax=Desulfocurvus vexinensis TaxID=399548 RepID=UPI00048C852A|nr:transporter substrate-binding domain-containing protein [Desulfocurvus vexinensis]